MDQVLYALGEIWRRGEVKTTIAIDNIPAGTCPCVIHYEKIVRDYPRSERVNDAKQRLKEMNWKIPEPNPAALARIDSKVEQRGIVGKVMGAVIDRGPADGNKTGATSVTVDSNKKRGEEALSATPKVIRP
jgi:hypothetical protein